MRFVGLAPAFIASTVALVSAQPAASNASALLFRVPSNSSYEQDHASRKWCDRPPWSSGPWYYLRRGEGPYYCYDDLWSMLNSYRAGGTENVHWKYTNDANDPECMEDWTYFNSDGKLPIIGVNGRLTMEGATRTWCALPVYRTGGVELYQWAYCKCK